MSMTPGLPAAPLVYYAEAIDRSSGPAFPGYRIIPALAANGLTVYRPATTWAGGQHHPALVERLNRDALHAADVIIADLSNPAVSSIGVPMELESATARGIPAVVLWAPEQPRSVVLQANPLVTFAELWEDAVSIATQRAKDHRADRERDIESPTLKFTMALGHEAPQPAFTDDAGFDLVTAVDTEIPAHGFVDIPTTVTGVQCPPGTWLLITGRSSAIRRRGLLVPNGIIDHGWRGPLMAGVQNMRSYPVTVLAGERVAQVILMPNLTEKTAIQKVEQLDPHDRGFSGFGSTGGLGRAAVPERDELESLRETVAILSDPGVVADIAEAEADVAAGRTIRLDELPWAGEGERMQALDGPGARPVGGAGWPQMPQTVEQEAAEYARVDALYPVNPIG